MKKNSVNKHELEEIRTHFKEYLNEKDLSAFIVLLEQEPSSFEKEIKDKLGYDGARSYADITWKLFKSGRLTSNKLIFSFYKEAANVINNKPLIITKEFFKSEGLFKMDKTKYIYESAY